jgi:hypothetical protein
MLITQGNHQQEIAEAISSRQLQNLAGRTSENKLVE